MTELKTAEPDHASAASDEAPPEIGTWRDMEDVGAEAAREAWADAARPALLNAARTYRAVVTHKELAAEVQHRSGIRTAQPPHRWIGDVLVRVSRDCVARQEPLLSALCVNADGKVGQGYADAVREDTGEAPADPDDHAAQQRLACYRAFDADGLPDDGGFAALTPRLAAARTRARNAERAARPILTCPTCHMALLPTGVCDTCG